MIYIVYKEIRLMLIYMYNFIW